MKKMKRITYLILMLFIIVGCSKDDNSTDTDNGNLDVPLDTSVNRQNVGSSANDILADDIFTKAVIEIVYVTGFEPTAAAISNFLDFAESRIHKPEGITLEMREIASPSQDIYTIEDIRNIEIANRTQYTANNRLAIWALFIDGQSSNDTNNSAVLGTAYWNTSFVIYEETIVNQTTGVFTPDQSLVENSVINHEFAHILGLTNLGTPMVEDHEDDENPKHCNVESCLMFFSLETSNGLSSMMGMSSAPELDIQCINDLQANGGK